MTFKKGDLVMVVRPTPCCHHKDDIGVLGVVADILTGEEWECIFCHADCGEEKLVSIGDAGTFYSKQLIKIDPPADDTEEVADKELEIVK